VTAVVGLLAARILGVVLLVAAFAKALDPHLFALQLTDLLPVPSRLAFAAAIAAIGFEAGLGAALLAGWRHPLVLAVTTATFVALLGVVTWQLLWPSEVAGGCGCFGQLVERTPQQAFYEDLVFVALAGLAWLGRGNGRYVPRWGPTSLAAVVGMGFALASPSLPLDDQATALAPGVTVGATRLDKVIPELSTGRHLVLLLDRADPDTQAAIPALNERLKVLGSTTAVWGVADEDAELAAAFLWSAGPAFTVRGASSRMLRTLYRALPRSALIDGGRVVRTWSGFPPEGEMEALGR
jgi:hypothetical protein